MQQTTLEWTVAISAAISVVIALCGVAVNLVFQRRAGKTQAEMLEVSKRRMEKAAIREQEERQGQTEELKTRQKELELKLIEMGLLPEPILPPDLDLAAPVRSARDTTPPETAAGNGLTVTLTGQSPYIVGPPILERRDFYGRQELVVLFFEHLLAGQLQSVSLLGARRSGKTSLLRHVSHPLTLHYFAGEMADRLVPVYLNLQAMPRDSRAFFNVLTRLTIREFEYRARTEVGNVPPAPGYDFLLQFFEKTRPTNSLFVLMLDEFELLAQNSALPMDFFNNLRALTQEPHVALVATSLRGLAEITAREVPDRVSPLFNVFYPQPLYLGAMPAEEARQLAAGPAERSGHPLSPEDVNFVCDLAGRLPFRLQAAADALYRVRFRGETGAAGRTSAREVFASSMTAHFEHQWRHFTDAERAALIRLAKGEPPAAGDGPALADLARYGFVEEIGGRYRVLGSAFEEWVRGASSQP